jgi:hypothetical protein
LHKKRGDSNKGQCARQEIVAAKGARVVELADVSELKVRYGTDKTGDDL